METENGMQTANDNLEGGVSGFDDEDGNRWWALHEAARKAVEACARERTANHQVGGGEDRHRGTRVSDGGRADHGRDLPFAASER